MVSDPSMRSSRRRALLLPLRMTGLLRASFKRCVSCLCVCVCVCVVSEDSAFVLLPRVSIPCEFV